MNDLAQIREQNNVASLKAAAKTGAKIVFDTTLKTLVVKGTAEPIVDKTFANERQARNYAEDRGVFVE